MRNLLTVLLFAVILLELAWAWNFFAQPAPSAPTPEAVTLPEAALALSPTEGTFAADENFEVQVVLEAEDNTSTDGADITLSFDPALLEVLDISSSDFYPQRLVNEVDSEKGIIRLALANTPNQDEVQGGGTVATITFKALQAGEAEIVFGETTSVAADGLNILSQTTGGVYLIE